MTQRRAGAARHAILRAIRDALGDQPRPAYPAGNGIPSTNVQPGSRSDLRKMFSDELDRIGGSCRLVAEAAELPAAVGRYVEEGEWASIVIQDRPAVHHAVSALGDRVIRARAWSDMEHANCAVVEAESLLADSASAIVVLRDGAERLLPYLPPVCIVIASAADLHAGMTNAALEPMFGPARRGTTGEAVILTGPSRTADIEKTLVLGAHGPHTLTVFIVEDPA